MLDIRSALALLQDAWPGAAGISQVLRDEWAPDPVPVTVLFEGLGAALAEEGTTVPDTDRRRVFDIVEALVVCGAHEVFEATSTGLLDAFVSASSGGRLDLQEVAPWMGPRSAEICRSRDEPTGALSPGPWPRPPDGDGGDAPRRGPPLLDMRSASAVLRDAWTGAVAAIAALEDEWSPDPIPVTGLFGDIGAALATEWEAVPDGDRQRLFDVIEALVVCGTYEVFEGATTGFLEAVLSASSGGPAGLPGDGAADGPTLGRVLPGVGRVHRHPDPRAVAVSVRPEAWVVLASRAGEPARRGHPGESWDRQPGSPPRHAHPAQPGLTHARHGLTTVEEGPRSSCRSNHGGPGISMATSARPAPPAVPPATERSRTRRSRCLVPASVRAGYRSRTACTWRTSKAGMVAGAPVRVRVPWSPARAHATAHDWRTTMS